VTLLSPIFSVASTPGLLPAGWMRTIASNQKALRPPGPFLRCTNWSNSCVNT